MKTLDDWPRIKRVLERALARQGTERLVYLAEACGPDAALRARIDSLLAGEERLGTFLEVPPAAHLRRRIYEDLSGRVVSSCQLVSRLGAGGMGEVYVAHDTRLDRPVAVKFLSSELAADRNRLKIPSGSADGVEFESPTHCRRARFRRAGWPSVHRDRVHRG